MPASSEMGSSGCEEPSRELSPAPLFSALENLCEIQCQNAMTCGISHVCSAEEEHGIEPHLVLKPGKGGSFSRALQAVGSLFLEPEFPDIALSWSDPIGSRLWVVLRMHSIEPDGIFHHTPCRALQPSNSLTTGFRRMQERNGPSIPPNGSSHCRTHHLQISDDGFMPCSITVKIDSAITQDTDTTLT